MSQLTPLTPSRKRAHSPTPPISPTTPAPASLPPFPPYALGRLRRQLLARRIITAAHTHYTHYPPPHTTPSPTSSPTSHSTQIPYKEPHPCTRCTLAGHFCYRRPGDDLQDKCAFCMAEGVDVMECRLECDEPVWRMVDAARGGREGEGGWLEREIFGGGSGGAGGEGGRRRKRRRTVYGAVAGSAGDAVAGAGDDVDGDVDEAKEEDDGKVDEKVDDRTIIKAGKITFRDPFSGSGQKKAPEVWEHTLAFRPAGR